MDYFQTILRVKFTQSELPMKIEELQKEREEFNKTRERKG